MSTVEFGFKIEIENHTLSVDVEATGKAWDELYGADADGRRGEWRSFVDVDRLVIKDARGNDITKKILDRHEEIYDQLIEKAEEKLLEDHSEPPEYEPDYE